MVPILFNGFSRVVAQLLRRLGVFFVPEHRDYRIGVCNVVAPVAAPLLTGSEKPKQKQEDEPS